MTVRIITLSELPTFGWKAKITDDNGVVYVGRGVSMAEAVFALFTDCPRALFIELRIINGDDDK